MLCFTMLHEAVVTAQVCDVRKRNGGFRDTANDRWDICMTVSQTVYSFEASFFRTSNDDAVNPR